MGELIAINHPVRVVDEVLSKIDIQPLVRQYKTGGTSSYHRGMLLKVLVYAYINNIYSSHLLSEEGIKKRKQRCWDVEPVFANIKNNHGFKRFMLRGKQKVTTETGLLALTHNLRKKATEISKKQPKSSF